MRLTDLAASPASHIKHLQSFSSQPLWSSHPGLLCSVHCDSTERVFLEVTEFYRVEGV